jgi:deazaflavin-dependent oxidoreductase (nitroreductase family)
MTRITGSLTIARRADEVFATVADQRNEPRFNPKMSNVIQLTDGPIGLGTRFGATVLSRGKPLPLTIEYTRFEPPSLLGSRSTMDGAVTEGHLRCEPTPEGTHFSWDWHVNVPGAPRVAQPLIGAIGRRQERVIWEGLRRLLEDGAETTAPARLPPRWFIVFFWRVHRAVFRLTDGRGLWAPRPGRSGTMRLITTGRRTGRPRPVILAYLEDGENLVTLAMNGWAPAEPAWWLNLRADPRAAVQLTNCRRDVTARAATGTEHDRLWHRWREVDRNLDGYARRRPAPTAVVVLEPTTPARAPRPG